MEEGSTLIINDRVSIPISELQFKFSTSGGPGGQHANRSNTKAILLFDVKNAPSLDETTREELLQKLASRLDKNGVIHIQAHDTRSQHQNRELAISRFIALLSEALAAEKERVETKPSERTKTKRKEDRKKHSQLKRNRGHDWSKDY